MRAFLAIELNEDVADAVARLQAALPCGRAVPRENLQLTVMFLGDQSEDRLQDLHFELENLAALPFEAAIAGLGSFAGSQPRTVFADVAPNPSLGTLRDRAVSAARRAGIRTQRRRFHPHITIARLRRFDSGGDKLETYLAQHADVSLPVLPVSGFALWSSSLHPDGARYEILARYQL